MQSGNVNWEIKGLAELGNQLRNLPDKLQKRSMRGAVGAGGKVIRDAARRNAPKKTGALQDAIRYTTSVKGTSTAIAKVFVSKKKAFYGRFVSDGTAPHEISAKNFRVLRFIPKSGVRPVFVRAIHHPGSKGDFFMERAADSSYALAVDAIADRLRSFFDNING